VKKIVQCLLEEFPKLVIDEDKVTDATRYYKGRAFTLGLPEDKRDKIYFRAQYPPNPQQIEKYREIFQTFSELRTIQGKQFSS